MGRGVVGVLLRGERALVERRSLAKKMDAMAGFATLACGPRREGQAGRASEAGDAGEVVTADLTSGELVTADLTSAERACEISVTSPHH